MYLFWYLYLHVYVQINKGIIVYMNMYVEVVYVQFDHLKSNISTHRNVMMLCDLHSIPPIMKLPWMKNQL